jgi:ATP-dependent Lhr-like helicase
VSYADALHPALQHHIVNSLGWRDLRPFQDAVIPPILAGKHLIILAPTAGGKTEAAFFPVLSRMLSEGWAGLSVLYICPIKALLNNLDVRLQRYCTLLGRQSALWHGDVKTAARRRILREPPDCLLTTPESLEVMLISPNVDAARLFDQLQVVIIDEIHAFAGDDRGWHLLAVLERISRLAGRELQRLGLSATVGNPETLVDWLAGSCTRERDVFLPPAHRDVAEVKLDYVGSLQNAAVVISRLHRGEKRLVFVDSRARAEQLAQALRQLEVATFVTHSSLSQEQRHAAETAFASRDNCVIVATSVLELGIDVGDLDRVIQIDSPPTVASFLQRMGRTGRRSGAVRNCLFLATRNDALMQAAGLLDLWATGYIEPIMPPAKPYHILAQQLMALALQEGGIGRREWLDWIHNVPALAQMPRRHIDRLVQWMLQAQLLWDDHGILWFGERGEATYGRRHFLDLVSVFTSPPLFAVRHGRQELGVVDEMTFIGQTEGPRVLLLGGMAWRVNHIDWQRRVAYVEATKAKGRSRWQGDRPGLGFHMCQSIKHLLAVDEDGATWSRRARQQIHDIRQTCPWLDEHSTVIRRDMNKPAEWWTFAGSGANAGLAYELSQTTQSAVDHDSFTVTFEPHVSRRTLERALRELRVGDVSRMRVGIDAQAIEGLKFSACLPYELAMDMLQSRLSDPASLQWVLQQPVRVLYHSGAG